MTLSFIRFAGIMLAALSLSFGLGHFTELPARMAWDQYLWVGPQCRASSRASRH